MRIRLQGIRRDWLRLVFAALILVLAPAGCASVPDRREEVAVVLGNADRVEYGGRTMTVEGLRRRLQRERVPAGTVITVQLTGTARAAAMADLVSALQRGGYARVVFVGERQFGIDRNKN